MNQILDKIPYDQIKSFPEWQRYAAVGVIIAVIFGAYFYFFFSKGERKIRGLEGQVKEVENKLAKTRQLEKKLPDLKNKIKVLEENLTQVRRELPSEREIPYFLKTISEKGIKAGLEIMLFKPEPEQVKDFYARVPVRMEVKGNFHNIMTFFDQVRRLPRIVDIENISIQVDKGKKDSSTLKTSCFATTYKYIEGAEQKEPPKPPGKMKKKGNPQKVGGH